LSIIALIIMFQKLFGRPGQRRIAESVWAQALDQMPFNGRLNEAERERLVERAQYFVSRKTFSGANGFVVDDSVRAGIALQACLPIIEIGVEAYDDFVEIIIYPDRFLAPRSRVDEAGVVHEAIEELSGEAMDGGPVVLAWPDLNPGAAPGASVVIHEFIHKLDMLDGEADGVPLLPYGRRTHWMRVLDEAYEQFCDALDDVEASIPIDVDPESSAADAYFSELPLDPYAATDHAEFFAVSGEVFFTHPEQLARQFPDLFSIYRAYFGFDLLRGQDCEVPPRTASR
jgi:Mlc titration factor MtfA (ptsG expression regulator)